MKNTIEVYIDGASRGNPGPSGIGMLIKEGEKDLARESKFIGETTNNVAEYQALIESLKIIKRQKKQIGLISLVIKSDSDLVVNQVTGNYKIRSKNLIPLAIEARRLLKEFKRVELKLISRKDNKIADKLANKSMNLQDDIDELNDNIRLQ